MSIPVPEWFGAGTQQTLTDDGPGTAHLSWFVPLGLDRIGSSLDVVVQSLDDFTPYATRHVLRYSDECETLFDPRAERVGVAFRDLVLCGKEKGSGRGVIVYTLRMPTPDRHTIDIWYRTEVEPFDARDPSSWPMTPAAFEAFSERMTQAIEVVVAGEPYFP